MTTDDKNESHFTCSRLELSETGSSDRSASNEFVAWKNHVSSLKTFQVSQEIFVSNDSFNESYSSAVLTSIIEDLILRSSLAHEYLLSQPIIIGHVEHSLPFVRNLELENDLLSSNESYPWTNPFVNDQDLEDYLTHCGRKRKT